MTQMPFNLAQLICSRHEDSVYRIALEELRPFGSNTYTFGGLDYLSDKFATVLQNCGIKQGETVAVMLPSSAAFVVAHFAILKLGAIVAPFSPQSSADLLNSLLKESQAKVLIIDEAINNLFEKPVIDLDDVQIYVASDYVSKNDFANQAKSFWREINFTDAGFKRPATNETTPAYLFFVQDEARNRKRNLLSHSSILSTLQADIQPDNESSDKESLLYSSSDWSGKDILLEELLTALYSGHQIMSKY